MEMNTKETAPTTAAPEKSRAETINKLGLTPEQVEAMADMTPKEKKIFLKKFR